MTLRRRLLFIPLFLGVAASTVALGQQPILSPRDSAEITLAGKRIFIDYGRPSMRGRVIMGGLVPYTRWWRTGANEATSFRTTADILVGDSLVPKGEYTLYTLPSEQQWKLIVNRQTGQWGTTYTPDLDLVRVSMKKKNLGKNVEKFTIRFERTGPRSCLLHLVWERTDVSIPITLVNGSRGPKGRS